MDLIAYIFATLYAVWPLLSDRAAPLLCLELLIGRNPGRTSNRSAT